MAIPSFQDFMLPLLELLQDGKAHKISEVREELARHFDITEEEKKVLLPSGRQEVYKNRIGWAGIYLYNADLIEKLDRGVYKITERGLEVLKEKPLKIDINYLMKFPEFREFKGFKGTKDKDMTPQSDSPKVEEGLETPLEVLGKMYHVIKEQLAKEILERIMQKPPEFFEKLIIDLLQVMGYGGSLEDAGAVTRKTSDEGIDGIIKEDKLGLDLYIFRQKGGVLIGLFAGPKYKNL